MKKVIRTIFVAGIVAFITTTAYSQAPTPLELPKVKEAQIISVAFTGTGVGRIRAADERGKVQQYLEIWENASKEANVITYVLVGDSGTTFSATWGKGPINTEAFRCNPGTVPDFGEKTLWVATADNGVLAFREIQDGDIKGLFGNITQARRDYGREANASNQRSRANSTEQNILSLLKEKTRKKWLENGWLNPVNACVRHF